MLSAKGKIHQKVMNEEFLIFNYVRFSKAAFLIILDIDVLLLQLIKAIL